MTFKTLSAHHPEVWFLISDDGGLAVRIHSGLTIGLDAGGEVTFQPDSALVACDVINGNVSIRAVTDGYELQESGVSARFVTIQRDSQARIELSGKYLELQSGTDSPRAETAETERLGLVRDIRVVSLQPDGQTPLRDTSIASLLRPVRAQRGGTVATLTPAATGTPQTQTEGEDQATGFVQVMGAPLRELLPYVLLALLLLFALTIAVLGLVNNKPEVTAKNAPAKDVPALEQRLAEVSAALAASQIADGFNDTFDIEAALRSAIALQQSYPEEPTIVALLEPLTQRLTQEARANFDRGDAFTAGRLIELAAITGVHVDEVQQAVKDFSAPRRILLPNFSDEERAETKPVDNSSESIDPAPEQAIEAADEAQPSQLEGPLSGLSVPENQNLSSDKNDALSISTQLSDFVSATQQLDAEARSGKTNQATPGVASIVREGTHHEPLDLPPSSNNKTKERAASTVPDLSLARAADVERPTVDNLSNASDLKGADPPKRATKNRKLLTSEAEPAPATRTSPTPATTPKDTQVANEAPLATAAPPPFFSVSELRVRKRKAPRFPRSAPNGASGSVVMNFTVNEQGNVGGINIDGNPPEYFLNAALKAIRQWKFAPVIQNSRAISVRTSIKFTFQI